MMNGFFTQLNCDRCRGTLENGRIMSIFNQDCLCKKCSNEEIKHKDYSKAMEAELEAVKNGNYNFKGIGYPDN